MFSRTDRSRAYPRSKRAATEPPNESGLVVLALLYRRLDDTGWTALDFPGFSGDSLVLPASTFIRNGLVIGAEYRILATDSAQNAAITNVFSIDIDYTSDLTSADLSTIPSVHSLNLPAGQEVKAYRLFSVPYDPLGPVRPQVLWILPSALMR